MGTGWWNALFIEWSLFQVAFLFPCTFSFFIRVLDPWSASLFHLSSASSLPPYQPVLTVVVFCFPVLPPLIYHPLCRFVHICRSIARIWLFVNYGTSLLFSIHVSNPVYRHRAAPPPHHSSDKVPVSSFVLDMVSPA